MGVDSLWGVSVAAAEEVEECLAEARVHEAVGDGVAATGRICQQLKETDSL